ncbi:putative MFS monosaccharide transporter [Aspergillus aculeatinus CBS 121060]|uniref:General substrate transporter n=2 Tax=Aspergillus subgen. Circumdati TaxID=2720871 RepID=A0ACD1HNG9_9EURO|nr:general substrate transporter [Aspergillus brunneoviolaceus CBS 621.78]XP_025508825.1 general substrate transporter [Aspergillus aculeatinus CBS 121060]RAH47445.1 general substrate transporter [Aspergillus brunneoviolaceus CBS 621.78]RAH75002.1 general substrate transporter [Aspergillus aculeatinus CBS 121060]
MAVGVGAEAISGKRAELAGNRVGWRGLLSSKKTFSIALFASLGGFVYGYNQGMFSGILTMNSFILATQHYAEQTGTAQGMLTSILELGAWVGTLANGYLADSLGRRLTVVVAVIVFCAGVIVQACTKDPSYVFGGRFVTGLGVGSLSMIVPLYNAELAPPEIRGSLVAVQQLSITFGIMVSFWICYGTNYIGGTGDGQSKAAWEVPVCIQVLPAIILAFGMVFFMPQSPRHLMNTGREEECLSTLARLRDASTDDILVRIEYLEIKSLKMFEQETSRRKYPQYQDDSFKSRFMIGVKDYASLVTDKSLFKRTTVACLVMTFQQWNGINAINYFAPQIFKELELGGNTTNLLATGVAGIFEFVFTIPAVLWVDNIGRKKILLAGAAGMAICHFICAGLIATYQGEFGSHRSAGWATVAFVWIFIINFAYSWGPCAWIVVSEVFPLSMRAKGVSLGGSSNWLNNFGVGLATSPFIARSAYGTFIFFGCLTVIGFLYVLFFVPETKGRTLEEMDEVFGSEGMAAEDEALRQQIDRDIGLTALLHGEMDASAEKMTTKAVHLDDAPVPPHTTEA